MSLPYLHLALNHLPIVSLPIGLLFLWHSRVRGNATSVQFSLYFIIASAALAIPVYFTGDPASELVASFTPTHDEWIEDHEQFAKISLWLSLVTGALAAAILRFYDKKFQKQLFYGLNAIGALGCLSLIYTANLGGQIRHREFYDDRQEQIEMEEDELRPVIDNVDI